jgi:hypothetical protein
MLNLNSDRLEAAALEAFDLAATSRRWQTAITRALGILRDSAFWNFDGDALVMLSPDSLEIYETTAGKCERIEGERRVTCKAYASGQPCKHRAARRLLARYHAAGN